MQKKGENSLILHLSTFPPRECGIATFTQDLISAINKRYNPLTKTGVIAINENETSFYNYPTAVRYQLTAESLDEYVKLAQQINRRKNIKIINIQHEFGIFGGDWGDYLIPFLQALKVPAVVTFHSVLPDPDEYLKKVVRLIAKNSSALVVMNERSKYILINDYHLKNTPIVTIPHGIPNTPYDPPSIAKSALQLEKKIILSTFGLLGPDKGIEYTLRALPPVVKKFPHLLYLVLGQTHPNLRRHEGERYRNTLIRETKRLGLQRNVKFYQKYLTLEEIIQYLKATDIYISTPINPKQSVSGTLSYALGCGRPVISSATEYARYIVDADCGILVPCKKSKSITKALLTLLEDKKRLSGMGQAAYEKTRHMTWPNVASSYFQLYQRFVKISSEEKKLPKIKIDHIIHLTNHFGIIQHAKYNKPDLNTGYSTDDNSRALIFCVQYSQHFSHPRIVELMRIYTRFLKYVQRKDGSFANIVSARGKRDKSRDEDVQGRAVWALGTSLSSNIPGDIFQLAEKLFQKTVPMIEKLSSPRACAFAMTGLYHILCTRPKKHLLRLFLKMAKNQIKLYEKHSASDWQWFEDRLTYSNSKLPESLYYAYDLTGENKFLDVAETTLKFLRGVTFEAQHYSPIGQNGWFVRNKKRAYFDQQPEDAASMVQTKIAAYLITKKTAHLKDAYTAFQWFLGKNHLHQMIYDEATGGCYDGVGSHSLNLNQGAESTLSYLLARIAFENPQIKKHIQTFSSYEHH